MKQLYKPGSSIISTHGDMFEVLAKQPVRKKYTKEELGYLVKYYKGDKLLKVNNVLFVCRTVEEANVID